MKFCTQCGAQLAEGVKFCTQCGNPIKQPAPAPEKPAYVPEPTVPVTPAPETAKPTPYIPPVHATPQKPKKTKQKKSGGKKVGLLIVCIVLAVAIAAGLLLFFLGGGMNLEDDTLGLYDGVSYRYGGADMSVKDDWIELKPFGIAKLMLAGDTYYATWSLDDEDFLLKQGGNTYEGTLEDGVLTLDLDGLIYTYVNDDAVPKDDDDRPAGTKPKDDDEDKPAPDAPAEEPVDAPVEAVPSAVGYWTLKYTEGPGDMTKSEEEITAMREEMGIEIYLELYEDGTGVINWEELSEITWDDNCLIAPDNSTVPYTQENGELVVDIEGTLFHFVPGEGIPGQHVSDTSTPDDLAYYEGDYYGWWYYHDVIVGDPELEGYWWDCCMTLDISSDGTGTMTIWDEDYDKNNPLAEVSVTVTVNDGVACITSEDGQFMGYTVGYADWMFYSDDTIYDDALGFYTMYADSEVEIECYFFMRPWGTVWDDAAEEDLPYYYYDWYLPLIEDGVTEAPSTIG